MKPEEVSSPDDVYQSPETMDFNSLIDDCKEMIFRRLDISDLLNLADSCKQLRQIAHHVCKAKLSGGKVTIDRIVSNISTRYVTFDKCRV